MFPTLSYADYTEDAIRDSDLTIVLTEWPEFVEADPAALGSIVLGRTVIDARNCLDSSAWSRAGWTVYSMGRMPESASMAPGLSELAAVR